jgi:hypothetical protein
VRPKDRELFVFAATSSRSTFSLAIDIVSIGVEYFKVRDSEISPSSQYFVFFSSPNSRLATPVFETLFRGITPRENQTGKSKGSGMGRVCILAYAFVMNMLLAHPSVLRVSRNSQAVQDPSNLPVVVSEAMVVTHQ